MIKPEIKFRAMVAGEMRYFDLDDIYGVEFDDGMHLPTESEIHHYSDIVDSYGTPVFQNDIVEQHEGGNVIISVVDRISATRWRWDYRGSIHDALGYSGAKFKVIGNTVQNPELLTKIK